MIGSPTGNKQMIGDSNYLWKYTNRKINIQDLGLERSVAELERQLMGLSALKQSHENNDPNRHKAKKTETDNTQSWKKNQKTITIKYDSLVGKKRELSSEKFSKASQNSFDLHQSGPNLQAMGNKETKLWKYYKSELARRQSPSQKDPNQISVSDVNTARKFQATIVDHKEQRNSCSQALQLRTESETEKSRSRSNNRLTANVSNLTISPKNHGQESICASQRRPNNTISNLINISILQKSGELKDQESESSTVKSFKIEQKQGLGFSIPEGGIASKIAWKQYQQAKKQRMPEEANLFVQNFKKRDGKRVILKRTDNDDKRTETESAVGNQRQTKESKVNNQDQREDLKLFSYFADIGEPHKGKEMPVTASDAENNRHQSKSYSPVEVPIDDHKVNEKERQDQRNGFERQSVESRELYDDKVFEQKSIASEGDLARQEKALSGRDEGDSLSREKQKVQSVLHSLSKRESYITKRTHSEDIEPISEHQKLYPTRNQKRDENESKAFEPRRSEQISSLSSHQMPVSGVKEDEHAFRHRKVELSDQLADTPISHVKSEQQHTGAKSKLHEMLKNKSLSSKSLVLPNKVEEENFGKFNKLEPSSSYSESMKEPAPSRESSDRFEKTSNQTQELEIVPEFSELSDESLEHIENLIEEFSYKEFPNFKSNLNAIATDMKKKMSTESSHLEELPHLSQWRKGNKMSSFDDENRQISGAEKPNDQGLSEVTETKTPLKIGSSQKRNQLLNSSVQSRPISAHHDMSYEINNENIWASSPQVGTLGEHSAKKGSENKPKVRMVNLDRDSEESSSKEWNKKPEIRESDEFNYVSEPQESHTVKSGSQKTRKNTAMQIDIDLQSELSDSADREGGKDLNSLPIGQKDQHWSSSFEGEQSDSNDNKSIWEEAKEYISSSEDDSAQQVSLKKIEYEPIQEQVSGELSDFTSSSSSQISAQSQSRVLKADFAADRRELKDLKEKTDKLKRRISEENNISADTKVVEGNTQQKRRNSSRDKNLPQDHQNPFSGVSIQSPSSDESSVRPVSNGKASSSSSHASSAPLKPDPGVFEQFEIFSSGKDFRKNKAKPKQNRRQQELNKQDAEATIQGANKKLEDSRTPHKSQRKQQGSRIESDAEGSSGGSLCDPFSRKSDPFNMFKY